ncbi:unnamed protein product [Urochloa humidicola]
MSRPRKSRTQPNSSKIGLPSSSAPLSTYLHAPSVASARPVPSRPLLGAQHREHTLAPAAGRGARQPGLVPPQASGERTHGTLRHHGSRQGRQGGRTAIWPSPTPSRPGAGGKLSRLEL